MATQQHAPPWRSLISRAHPLAHTLAPRVMEVGCLRVWLGALARHMPTNMGLCTALDGHTTAGAAAVDCPYGRGGGGAAAAACIAPAPLVACTAILLRTSSGRFARSTNTSAYDVPSRSGRGKGRARTHARGPRRSNAHSRHARAAPAGTQAHTRAQTPKRHLQCRKRMRAAALPGLGNASPWGGGHDAPQRRPRCHFTPQPQRAPEISCG